MAGDQARARVARQRGGAGKDADAARVDLAKIDPRGRGAGASGVRHDRGHTSFRCSSTGMSRRTRLVNAGSMRAVA